MAIDKIDSNAIANDAVTSTKIDDSQITLGFRNRIIGGNFSTNPWQRGTSFTGVTSEYTADRFVAGGSQDGSVDISKTADAPTIAQAGIFTQHCLHADVQTADSSIGASQYYEFYQFIEGYNIMDLGFGQSGTRYVTLSFWHKHTKTGTNCISIRNGAVDRSYVVEYTQSVSDTWEKEEITIPVDTTGTHDYTNQRALQVVFTIAAGTDRHTTADAWQSGAYTATSNQVNNLDSTSNNFKIALVQLEAGQTATAFENRSVGQELSLCQRYFFASEQTTSSFMDAYQNSASNYHVQNIAFPVQMRATPTVTADLSTNWTLSNVSQFVLYAVNDHYGSYRIRATAAGRFYAEKNTNDGATNKFSAEL